MEPQETPSMPDSFVCPACSASSAHPDDIANGYCGRCHWWTGLPSLAVLRPELFTRNDRQPPDLPIR